MKNYKHIIGAALIAAASLGAAPVSAQSLLGGLGLGSGASGGVDGVATLASSSSGGGSSTNATLLGGGGNTLSTNLLGVPSGGSNSLGVTLPGTGTLVGNLGGTNVAPGGLSGLLNSGLLGGGNGTGIGGNGTGGSGGVGGNGGFGAGGFGFNGAGGAGFGANCVGDDGRQVLNFAATQGYNQRSFSAWSRASNIQVIPIKICPNGRKAVAQAINQSSNIRTLQGAVASDPLINASLNRTRFRTNNVLAVAQQGDTLAVYVY